MQVDDGILSRRRWISLGAIALVLVVVVGALASTGAQDAPAPPPAVETTVPTWPSWEIGQYAGLGWAQTASLGAGSSGVYGRACEMPAGTKGEILDMVGEAPDGWALLVTVHCVGWVSMRALARP